MKTKKMFSKVLAAALAVLMLIGLMPVFASAAENEAAPTADTSATDDLVLSKTATLEDDGTYTIVLDAYAKGQVSTTTLKKVVPTDVVLVLDQSGSMTQESIDGIPSGTYTETTATNAELADSSNFYYYKVGETYYRLTATKEIISKTITWAYADGTPYAGAVENLLTSWTASNGNVYNTANPYDPDTLKTYTRETTTTLGFINTPKYVNDKDSSDTVSGGTSMATLRSNFLNKGTDGYTAVTYNDIPEGATGWQGQDPYYVAALYKEVTRQEVNICRYVYTYTDGDGKTVTVGTSAEDIESNLNNINAAVSPIYIQGTTDGSRLDALKYAAEKFIDSIYVSAAANGVDHRVAVVGFATDEYTGTSSEHYYSNSELFIGATQYNIAEGGKKSTYNTAGNLAADHYDEAFQSVRTEEGYNNLYASIGELAGDGATHPQLGFQMANGIFGANDATGRNRVVIFLTDGQPGDSGYDATVANDTITQASTTKTTYGAKVFTVAVLNASEVDDNIDTFLKTVASDGTYTLATSTAALEGFFETVDEEISGTTTEVTLTENSYLVDRLSDYFVVPVGFSPENNVTVQVAKHVGYEAFGAPSDAPAGVVASVSYNTEGTEIRGISVRGFNFVSTGDNGNLVWDNTADTDAGSLQAGGNKLIVTITGLLAKDEAAVGTYINTNNETSGIWDTDGEGNYGMLKAFPVPTTLLDKKTFVLDYAKGAELDVYNATRFDSAADFLFSKVLESNNTYAGNYGSVAIADGKVIYTPNTMKWDGYDTFYALGKDATKGDENTKNIWSKVNVLPANNVYYEDTFVSQDADGNATGLAGITYTGNWTEVGTGENDAVDPDVAGKNTETPNNPVHGGWIEGDPGLSNDTSYSDGSAHTSSSAGAKATFSFTGTGFDIYGRTNGSTGTVLVQVKNTSTEASKYLAVDCLAESGDYYQIPTLWFSDVYGTYEVTITVTAAAGERLEYYLDGIKIYNPMNPEEPDQTVADAYGDELNATFVSVRDMLLHAESFNSAEIEDDPTTEEDESKTVYPVEDVNGVLFIDRVMAGDTNGDSTANYSGNEIGVYESYGPANEVYLAPDNAIAFYVGTEYEVVHVGLKTINSTSTTNVSNGDASVASISVDHTTDLFYPIVPDANGFVVIRNVSTSTNAEADTPAPILSVTKLKLFADSGDAEVELATASTEALLLAVDEFDTMPVVAYSLRASAPETEEPTEPEAPVDPEQPTEPETPVEPETPTEPSGPNVEIENPEEPVEPEQPDIEAIQEQIKQFVTSLFNAFRGWFGR